MKHIDGLHKPIDHFTNEILGVLSANGLKGKLDALELLPTCAVPESLAVSDTEEIEQ